MLPYQISSYAISERIMVVCSVALLLGSALISSCSAWDIIGAVVKPSPGIAVETEVVVGDKQQEIASGAVVGKKQTTTNSAETITQTYTTVNEAKTDYWLYLFGLIGWLLPSPRQLWIKIKSFR